MNNQFYGRFSSFKKKGTNEREGYIQEDLSKGKQTRECMIALVQKEKGTIQVYACFTFTEVKKRRRIAGCVDGRHSRTHRSTLRNLLLYIVESEYLHVCVPPKENKEKKNEIRELKMPLSATETKGKAKYNTIIQKAKGSR